jgi:hypothetical protein
MAVAKAVTKARPEAPELTEDLKDKVVELYRSGTKTSDITAATGVNRPTIYWILQKRGITPTRTKRPSGEGPNLEQLIEQLKASERENGRLEAEVQRLTVIVDHLEDRLRRLEK